MKAFNSFPVKLLIYISFFAVSMAMLESAVVIYLRALLYPEGFSFPLKLLNKGLGTVELWREVATIVMLAIIGWFAGHNKNTRFAWFLYSFAIWDIFYYVFLKIFLNWPESLATWDVLFLIPMMWVGPVWSPVLLAFLMIVLCLMLVQVNQNGNVPLGINWIPLLSGTITCIAAFCWDPIQFVQVTDNLAWYELDRFFGANYVPIKFPMTMYLTGVGLIILGIANYGWQNIFSNRRLTRSQII